MRDLVLLPSPGSASAPDSAKALALALERLRRATSGMLDAINSGVNIDRALSEAECAVASASVPNGNYLAWAQDVLDGLVVPSKQKGRPPTLESFDSLKKRAARSGIYLHFVHTLEGTEFAIYRNRHKVGHAMNETTCAQKLKRILAAQ